MIEEDFEIHIDRLIASSTHWFTGRKSKKELSEIDAILEQKIELFDKLRKKIDIVIRAGEIQLDKEREIAALKSYNENRNIHVIDDEEERIEKLVAAVSRLKQKNSELETELKSLKEGQS